MVQIILRDDDLNINCLPEDLDIFFEASKYYDEISLSMVPFPKKDSKLGDNNYKKLDFSSKNNFILKAKKLLEIHNVTLSMHGISHNGFAEFKNQIELSEILNAKAKLENTFNVEVNTFTPPNNVLSKHNFFNLVDANFKRIFSAFSNWPHERPLSYCYIDHFLRSSFLALRREKGRRIIRDLKYKNIQEYPSFVLYTKSDLNELLKNIHKSKIKKDQTIIIATHFWELWRTHPDQLLSIPNKIRCQNHS